MSDHIKITDVRLRFPSWSNNKLVCWASCIVAGGLKLANIAVMRGDSGRLALGFPARFSKAGGKHFYFEPVDRETRRALEEAILGKLPGFRSDTGGGGRELPGHSARDERRSKP
jgi:DNA-binding cell septation regulator SpoVG